jgi:hypothetical protein
VQTLSEVVFVHGASMASANVQLSEISKPVRYKLRATFRGKAPVSRADLPAHHGLYFAPQSTVQEQLVICAPERWPELLDTTPHLANQGECLPRTYMNHGYRCLLQASPATQGLGNICEKGMTNIVVCYLKICDLALRSP